MADLEGVLDERGIDRCVLAGSSMGAATAMAFALDHPGRVDALVQITPAYDGEARTGASSLETLGRARRRHRGRRHRRASSS